MDWIEKKWRAFAESLHMGDTAANVGWVMLSSMYAGRAYHNLQHVGDMLAMLEDANTLVDLDLRTEEQRRTVELAVWFHDIVYRTKGVRPEQNEDESAFAMLMFIRSISARKQSIANPAYYCILATKHAAEPYVAAPSNVLHCAIVDLDLAGLGSDRETYIGNSRRIREEYAHVDDAVWWANRGKFLRRMLCREHVFTTEGFRARFEAQARGNMRTELEYVNKRLEETA